MEMKLTPLNHNFSIGTAGGADHFCLQKSRMPIGRIGIFVDYNAAIHAVYMYFMNKKSNNRVN